MGKKDSKPVLWENVHALMTAAYGAERLGQFARDCHLGPATMTRIKAKETSVGLDVLDSIASRFNLEPWQLLAPQLGAGLYVVTEDRRLVSAAPEAATVIVPTTKPQPERSGVDTPEIGAGAAVPLSAKQLRGSDVFRQVSSPFRRARHARNFATSSRPTRRGQRNMSPSDTSMWSSKFFTGSPDLKNCEARRGLAVAAGPRAEGPNPSLRLDGWQPIPTASGTHDQAD